MIFVYWSIGHELTYAVEVIDEKLITNTVGGYQWLFGRDRWSSMKSSLRGVIHLMVRRDLQ